MKTCCAWKMLTFVSAFCLLFAGCGGADHPPVASVSGTVTLDGEPAEGLLVLFKPTEGRAATGLTDGDGKYNLEYAYGIKGAKLGPSTVMFEWPLGTTGVKPLADQYTSKSDLKREVVQGRNTFDFELKSGGQVTPKPVGAD